MKPIFSVTVIAKNEAVSLPNLLKSLEEFKQEGGEFILVDTGSTDDTVKIARDWGAKVIEVGAKFIHAIDEETAQKINEKFVVREEEPIVKAGDSYFDFGEARDFAMMQATNDWVLCPGCDEVFKTLNIEGIHSLIAEGNTQLRTDYIYSLNDDGTPKMRFYRDAYLFDRRIWKWVGCIHETVTAPPDAKWINMPTEIMLVEHHQLPQNDRQKRDVTGLAISCFSDPTNDRNAHYFARQLMFMGRFKSAVRQFINHSDRQAWDLERGQSLTFIGDCYHYLGDDDEALRWYNESFRFCSARRAPLMAAAELCFNKKDFQRAAAYASAALTVPYISFYANDMAHYSDRPHKILYTSLWWLGDKKGAEEHWKKAMALSPNNPLYRDEGKFFGAGTDAPEVEAVLPDIFKHKSVLYVGASPARQVLAQEFKNGGADVDLVEIWQPNIDELKKARPDLFSNMILGDARSLSQVVDKTYDVVCWWHGPEHIKKEELAATLAELEKVANDTVLLGCPFGNYPQGAVGGNESEIHQSVLQPQDFAVLGYQAVTFGVEDDPAGYIIAWRRK